jgi:hypothetical protein
MTKLSGGVSRRRYCRDTWDIIMNNDIDPIMIGYIFDNYCGDLWERWYAS